MDDSFGETAEMTTTKMINLINDKLLTTATDNDVYISYRMGHFDHHKNRPIIVKFTRRRVQNNIIKNAKMLKGTGI